MIYLLLCWVAGFLLRSVAEWVIKKDAFKLVNWIPMAALSVALGAALSYFARDIDGYLSRFIFMAAGFLSLFFFSLLHKLQKLEEPK